MEKEKKKKTSGHSGSWAGDDSRGADSHVEKETEEVKRKKKKRKKPADTAAVGRVTIREAPIATSYLMAGASGRLLSLT